MRGVPQAPRSVRVPEPHGCEGSSLTFWKVATFVTVATFGFLLMMILFA